MWELWEPLTKVQHFACVFQIFFLIRCAESSKQRKRLARWKHRAKGESVERQSFPKISLFIFTVRSPCDNTFLPPLCFWGRKALLARNGFAEVHFIPTVEFVSLCRFNRQENNSLGEFHSLDSYQSYLILPVTSFDEPFFADPSSSARRVYQSKFTFRKGLVRKNSHALDTHYRTYILLS